MTVLTITSYPGRKYEAVGLVQGSDIRTVHLGKDLGAKFKNIVGGELRSYTELLETARAKATERMIEDAQSKGCDAIIGMYYASSDLLSESAEITAYGTGIKFID